MNILLWTGHSFQIAFLYSKKHNIVTKSENFSFFFKILLVITRKNAEHFETDLFCNQVFYLFVVFIVSYKFALAFTNNLGGERMESECVLSLIHI